ncbi:hypothetical protein BaRGS_00008972 [Batillaria attramentaria]|uniref:ATP-grasp domain-containing protein n=1 Tax=Batillaria attramentaria TaxID=370345 RepID=A0ABD0LKU4_9CAEN|nr:hypothetical protein BaRGS_034888 [Batillaria attramentaria]
MDPVDPRDIKPDPRMLGKRILFVGVNDNRKDYIWEIIDRLGAETYAVGNLPTEDMERKVKKYIYYDFSQHSQDQHHAEAIVKLVKAQLGDVDGSICFWDADIPLAALVTARLGKPGISYAGALAAMSKTLTLEALTSSDQDHGKGSEAVKYASRCFTIESAADVKKCVEKIGLPAVLKTEFGAGAMGVKLVHSLQEAVDHFNRIQVLHDEHKDRSYILGGNYKRSCVLMEYLEGSEHCVDLALYHGELVCAFVSDKGPPIPPNVFKTVITMPSLLPDEKLEPVITAAFECCKALGLSHGVFDVDIMLTKSGPKLIEINPRMGGYCQREFILQCYNVDLVHLSCMIACNIRPHFALLDGSSESGEKFAVLPSRASRVSLSSVGEEFVLTESAMHAVPSNHSHMVGMYVFPWRHGKALKTTATPEILQRLHDDGELFFICYDHQVREYDHEIPFCSVAVKAESFVKARDKMVAICQRIGLEADDVSLEELLDYFKTDDVA